MNVTGSQVMQAVDMWALKQAMMMGQQQALAPITTQITNQLAVSLDPNLGRNLDIRA